MKSISVPCVLVLAIALAGNAQTVPAPAVKSATPAPKPATARKAAPAKSAAPDPVVLTVGNEKMTKSQFEALVASLPEQVRATPKRKIAEQLVELKSLAYEARQRKLDQSPEVKQRIALQIDQALANEMVRNITDGLKVDDAAVRAYYEQHKKEYEQAKASHILIRFKGSAVPLKPGQKDLTEEEALAKAKELREKLVKGGDFAAIAKAESDDASSGANGGSLGAFTRGRMVAVFEQAAFSQPIGEIGEPVKSQFGYHIIKVEQRTGLEEARQQVEAKLKTDDARKAVEDLRKTVPTTLDDQYFGK
jgi:peptidyl-prolyl cis-trans isomerase C